MHPYWADARLPFPRLRRLLQYENAESPPRTAVRQTDREAILRLPCCIHCPPPLFKAKALIFAQNARPMIQRLQSVFLLFASGSCFGLFGADAADSSAPVPASALFADAQFDLFDDPVLIALFVLAGLLFLANIFLFKNRKLQVKLNLLALLLALTGVAYGGYRFVTDLAFDTAAEITPDFGVVLPVLTLVFALLANKYIKADEKLVRSADRLR